MNSSKLRKTQFEIEEFEEGSDLDFLDKELKKYGFYNIENKNLFDIDGLSIKINKHLTKGLYKLSLFCIKDYNVYYSFNQDFKKIADLAEFLQNIETTHVVKDRTLVLKEIEKDKEEYFKNKDKLDNFLLGKKN